MENSNFDTERNYISLSHVGLEEGQLIKMYREGFTDSEIIRLKCYKGYQMEKDLLVRLKQVFGGKITTRFEKDIEITAFGGIVKGHPDFLMNGFPGDIKSVLMDDWLPLKSDIPRKVYFQIQGYMLYMEKESGILVYESRESGIITDIEVKRNERVQKVIHEKLENVVRAVKMAA